MPKIRYVGPIDEVDIPLLGRSVSRDSEPFEVSDEVAGVLLAQVGNFAPVGDALDVMTVDELKALAEENGVDLTGLTKKADIAAAIKKG